MCLLERLKLLFSRTPKFNTESAKHLILKGAQVDNRAILFLGLNAVYSEDEYGHKLISFSNRPKPYSDKPYLYYADSVIIKIRTFRQLLHWYRLLGKTNSKCLVKEKGAWKSIVIENNK